MQVVNVHISFLNKSDRVEVFRLEFSH